MKVIFAVDALFSWVILRYVLKTGEPSVARQGPVFSLCESCPVDTPWAAKWPVTPIMPGFYDWEAGNCSASAEHSLAEVLVPVCDRVWGDQDNLIQVQGPVQGQDQAEEEGPGQVEEMGGLVGFWSVEYEHAAPPQTERYHPLGVTGAGASATGRQVTAVSRFVWFWSCFVFCFVGFLLGLGSCPESTQQTAVQGRQSQDVNGRSAVVVLRETRLFLEEQEAFISMLRSLGRACVVSFTALACELVELHSVVLSKDGQIARLVQRTSRDESEIAALNQEIVLLREQQQSAKDNAGELSATIDALRAEVAELQSTLDLSVAKGAEILASNHAQAEEVERLTLRVSAFQSNYDIQLGLARQWDAEQRELKATIADLESRLIAETSGEEVASHEPALVAQAGVQEAAPTQGGDEKAQEKKGRTEEETGQAASADALGPSISVQEVGPTPLPPQAESCSPAPVSVAGGSGRDGPCGGDKVVVRFPQKAKATTREEIERLSRAAGDYTSALGYTHSPQSMEPELPAYVDPDLVVPFVEQRFEEALTGEPSSNQRTRRAGALVTWHRRWLQGYGKAWPTWFPIPHRGGRSLEVDMPPSLQALHVVPNVIKGPAPCLAMPLADIPEVSSPVSSPVKKPRPRGELALSKWAS